MDIMTKCEQFEIDMMNGMSLCELETKMGEWFEIVLSEYNDMVKTEVDKVDFLFYEQEDILVLNKYGFNDLVGA